MVLSTLCYVRHNGKTLMLHRNRKKDDVHEGKYNGLGGKFEPGESPEECVRREVLEESGLKIKKPWLHGVIMFPLFSKNQDWMVFIFTAEQFTGELIDSSEGELVWIENDKILQLNLWEGDRIFLPWLDRKDFFSGKFVYQNKKLVHYEVTFYPVG